MIRSQIQTSINTKSQKKEEIGTSTNRMNERSSKFGGNSRTAIAEHGSQNPAP